jgi:hypothetical protein
MLMTRSWKYIKRYLCGFANGGLNEKASDDNKQYWDLQFDPALDVLEEAPAVLVYAMAWPKLVRFFP